MQAQPFKSDLEDGGLKWCVYIEKSELGYRNEWSSTPEFIDCLQIHLY